MIIIGKMQAFSIFMKDAMGVELQVPDQYQNNNRIWISIPNADYIKGLRLGDILIAITHDDPTHNTAVMPLQIHHNSSLQ